MITHSRILQRLSILCFVLSLFFLGCAANPLTPGSLSLKNNKVPLGFSDSGQPLMIRNLIGNPFILYVKSKWCPLCKNLDATLEEGFMRNGGKGPVSLITLELVERKILDQSGVVEVVHVPGEETGIIPGLLEEKERPNRFVGNSGSVKKILKLKRIPVLIGFNKKGQVAGTLYGYQSEMYERFEGLLELVIMEEVELTGKSAF